jgi:hypothetical protein
MPLQRHFRGFSLGRLFILFRGGLSRLFWLGVYGGMVGIQHFAYRVKVAGELVHVRCRRVPLRYNNDKRKKPLFSRGLSVCRHLFNSFSKLKSDEKNIEKRRLFH